MTDYIQIEWMAASVEEACKVVKRLLEEKLIACANLIKEIESHYVWKGVFETSIEVKVLLKSHKKYFNLIQTLITEHSSYEVPAILSFSILESSPKYLQWLKDSLSTHVLKE